MLMEFCQDIHSELGDIDPVHTDTAMFVISHKLSDELVFICQFFHFFFVRDQDVEVDKQCHFAIVNTKTAATVAVSVCRGSGNNILFISIFIIDLSLHAAAAGHVAGWQSARWGGLAYCQKEKPRNGQ